MTIMAVARGDCFCLPLSIAGAASPCALLDDAISSSDGGGSGRNSATATRADWRGYGGRLKGLIERAWLAVWLSGACVKRGRGVGGSECGSPKKFRLLKSPHARPPAPSGQPYTRSEGCWHDQEPLSRALRRCLRLCAPSQRPLTRRLHRRQLPPRPPPKHSEHTRYEHWKTLN